MRTKLFTAATLAILTGCHTVYNWTGTHQAKALAEAREYADADPRLRGADIDCKKHDSDSDGDVTCTVHGPDDRVTLECPTRKLLRFTEDHGCKETERFSGKIGRTSK